MKETFARFWRDRSERERIVIAAGALLLALAFAYSYAWLPVTRERDRLIASVPQLREAAQAMERDAQELDRLKVARRPVPRDIKAAIEQAATASGMRPALAEVATLGADRARVVIPSVRAADWFAWLARLQSELGIRLESARVASHGGSDAVKVEAVFAATR
jgi:type II secretory pathway component PulM